MLQELTPQALNQQYQLFCWLFRWGLQTQVSLFHLKTSISLPIVTNSAASTTFSLTAMCYEA